MITWFLCFILLMFNDLIYVEQSCVPGMNPVLIIGCNLLNVLFILFANVMFLDYCLYSCSFACFWHCPLTLREGHAVLMKWIWNSFLLFRSARIWEGLALAFLWIHFYSLLLPGYFFVGRLLIILIIIHPFIFWFFIITLIVWVLLELYPFPLACLICRNTLSIVVSFVPI